MRLINLVRGVYHWYDRMWIDATGHRVMYCEEMNSDNTEKYVELYADHSPPKCNYQSAFGIDAPDEGVFEFDFKNWSRKVMRLPKIGSFIKVPYVNREVVAGKIMETGEAFQNWKIELSHLERTRYMGDGRLIIVASRVQLSTTTGTLSKEKVCKNA
ncbi:MAG: hypothetical protein ACW99G_22245 [Candidatus Thorarchaeota archaeon]